MKPVVKVLLGGCAVLLVLAMIAAVFAERWFSANKDRLRAESEKIRAEARAFGATTTKSGCVTDTLTRYRNDTSVLGRVRARVWLTGCLDGAPPDLTFCDGVPARTQLKLTINWRLSECARLGFADDAGCANLLTSVQEHCERATAAPSPDSQK